jgi:hypothetical protein
MSTVVEPDPTVAETNAPVIAKSASFDFPALFAQIVDITRDLFPGEVSAYLLDDPEFPQDGYLVFEAQARGTAEDAVERRLEWHRRVIQVHESCSNLTITFDFQE